MVSSCPSGVIYGEKITRKEEDNIRLVIDEVLKRFHPMVKPQNYRVTFTPVESRRETSRCVVEIRLAPGETGELYEDMYREVLGREQEGDGVTMSFQVIIAFDVVIGRNWCTEGYPYTLASSLTPRVPDCYTYIPGGVGRAKLVT